MLTPKITKSTSRRKVTISLENWKKLSTLGSATSILEEILSKWYVAELQKLENYFVDFNETVIWTQAGTKSRTAEVRFDVWNRLKIYGDPSEVLAGLIAKRIKETPNVNALEFTDGELETSEQALKRLRNALAQANAMHWHKKAEKIKAQIYVLESPLD